MFRGSKKQAPPKEEVFDIDLEKGTVTRKVDGVRVVALVSPGWANLEKELETTFITGAAVILQRMGYSYGRALGRAAKRKETQPEQAFDALQSFARESGWGQLTLNSGDLSAGQARIVVKDCFFCLHAHDAAEPVCHILVGLVGGVSDEIIGATHRVTEQRCIAKGDTLCEIVIERVG
jgi:predicted hydrocarbon binding protein